ncbi:unnamed protein product [Rotaria magnacalcarata]|uniref:Uncharacterized protein n=2 Tax=Rotaria magnacalcarata TaxID=392030 RepID=A0A816PNV5_9BILA|nr:unnamed protein product [Rotaria magnacalcarata]CAF4051201.1 unnamed protein product [Rotaria magnacalcarata]
MSSANPFLSSTAYHASNARYASSQTPSTSTSSSFNILSTSVQQQLNDLNSTRSSTSSSCSTSHCLSNQCIECTTILSTRPSQSRCNLNSYIDQSPNSPHFVQNCSCVSNSTLDNHSQISTFDDQQSTRILSMNIPVDNSNNNNHRSENPINSSSLNIEIEEEEDDDDDQRIHLLNEYNDQNEQLEVFVGFYRPGEYQRETIEDDDDDDDDDDSKTSYKSDTQKKEEQSTRELISDEDEGNEDQDFIDEDLCPNQDDDIDQQQADDEIINEEQLNPNIPNNDHQPFEQNPFPIVIVQIDEDEDQGFGAQFNDDCQSSDDENNHLSTISLNNDNNENENELIYTKKKLLQHSQSDSALNKCHYHTFLSLPSLSINSRNRYEKIEHIIIDDQQPITTMSNLISKKKQNDDNDYLFLRKKKLLRKSSEEIMVVSNDDSLQANVDDAVRAVERHVMLWNDDHARQIDNLSSIQQIVQYFQLNIDINTDQQARVSSIRKELLLDYLQYRSEADMSANDLHENLLQYPEFSSQIHSRFFPFWPPRDVDLLQWLSHWIKQGALPIAIMNIDHHHQSQKINFYSKLSSWQHRIIYGIEPRGIYLMNPIQIQSPQQVYEQLTIDSVTYITCQEIAQRYNQSPMCLTPLARNNNKSRLFSDTRWRTMNVLGQVVNVLREDRQLNENETRNIPYRPTVTHVRIPSTCSSGILIFSKDYNELINAIDLPLRQ